MQRVADWQLANFPDPSQRDPRGWEVAPFYIGTLALDLIAPGRRYQQAMLERGEANQWEPHNRMYHADDYCIVQAYLELYQLRHDSKMLEHVQPIGAAPHGFDPRHTEPFAIGAFLLSGSEVYRLADGRATRAPSVNR